jgi:hypothetical protein
MSVTPEFAKPRSVHGRLQSEGLGEDTELGEDTRDGTDLVVTELCYLM